jgi:hypothetical protein
MSVQMERTTAMKMAVSVSTRAQASIAIVTSATLATIAQLGITHVTMSHVLMEEPAIPNKTAAISTVNVLWAPRETDARQIPTTVTRLICAVRANVSTAWTPTPVFAQSLIMEQTVKLKKILVILNHVNMAVSVKNYPGMNTVVTKTTWSVTMKAITAIKMLMSAQTAPVKMEASATM